MKLGRKMILLLSIPVVLFFTLRDVNWRRFHPAPTARDNRCRTILLAADRIEVTLDTWQAVGTEGFAVDHKTKHITKLKPAELRDVVTYLNVTQECYPCSDGGMMCNPTLSFSFYKGSKVLGGFTVGDGEYSYGDPSSTSSWSLHPTSIIRLQEIMKQHPEINFGVSIFKYWVG